MDASTSTKAMTPIDRMKAKETPEALALLSEFLEPREDGVLICRKAYGRGRGRHKIGDVVHGWLNGDGRRQIKFHGAFYCVHRILFALSRGRWPEADIDHKDVDTDNNALANLREASRSQNNANSRANSGHLFKGVSFWSARRSRKPWRSKIKINGKQHHLGYFESPIQAAIAHDLAALEAYGEFARGTFVEGRRMDTSWMLELVSSPILHSPQPWTPLLMDAACEVKKT